MYNPDKGQTFQGKLEGPECGQVVTRAFLVGLVGPEEGGMAPSLLPLFWSTGDLRDGLRNGGSWGAPWGNRSSPSWQQKTPQVNGWLGRLLLWCVTSVKSLFPLLSHECPTGFPGML